MRKVWRRLCKRHSIRLWVQVLKLRKRNPLTQSSVTYDTGISLEAFAADASVSLTGILVGDIDDSYSGLIA